MCFCKLEESNLNGFVYLCFLLRYPRSSVTDKCNKQTRTALKQHHCTLSVEAGFRGGGNTICLKLNGLLCLEKESDILVRCSNLSMACGAQSQREQHPQPSQHGPHDKGIA